MRILAMISGWILVLAVTSISAQEVVTVSDRPTKPVDSVSADPVGAQETRETGGDRSSVELPARVNNPVTAKPGVEPPMPESVQAGNEIPLDPTRMGSVPTGYGSGAALMQPSPDPLMAPRQKSSPTRLTSRLMTSKRSLLTTRLGSPAKGSKEPTVRQKGLRSTLDD